MSTTSIAKLPKTGLPGLIVVIVDVVQSLGHGDVMAGYRYTLATIVMASILQTMQHLAGHYQIFSRRKSCV